MTVAELIELLDHCPRTDHVLLSVDGAKYDVVRVGSIDYLKNKTVLSGRPYAHGPERETTSEERG